MKSSTRSATDFWRVSSRDPFIHQPAIATPLLDGVEPGIANPILHSQSPADALPEAVHQTGDNDRPVLRGKYAVWNQTGMFRSLGLRIVAREERQLREIAKQAHQPVEQADVNQTSAPRDAALIQRCHDAHRAIDSADQVPQRNPQFDRGTAGLAIDAQGA